MSYTRQQVLERTKSGTPTVLKYSEMGLLPTRTELCGVNTPLEGPVTFSPVSYCDNTEYVKGEQVYRPCIFGYLTDGRKVCVKITNPSLYLDIKDPGDVKDFQSVLTTLLKTAKIATVKIEQVSAKPLKYFTLQNQTYYRVWFKSTWPRIETIKQIDQLNDTRRSNAQEPIQTATDDNDWFLIYLRENKVSSAGWNVVTDYTVDNTMPCLTLVAQQENIKKDKMCTVRATPLNCTWDIETHRTVQNGEIPKREDPDWTLICANLSYYWGTSTIPICDINITSVDAAPLKGLGIIIQCDGQEEATFAFARCFQIMQPDTITAFNGGCFDWPIMLGAIKRHMGFAKFKQYASMIPPYKGETDEASEKRHVTAKKRTKISAETTHTSDAVINLPGLLDADCMVVFMKLYAKADVAKGNSLNFYLRENKLEPKEDLPYKLMFRIYELALEVQRGDYSRWDERIGQMRGEFSRLMGQMMPVDEPTTDDARKQAVDTLMSEVLYYCKVDAGAVQKLFIARNVMGDAMEFANFSFTRMFDSFYHADGMRVLNYIGHYVKMDGYLYSNRSNHIEECDKDCYTGGYVDDPICGLIREAVVGLDFSSLYPNVIMAGNYSPDRLVIDPELAASLIAKGYRLKEITVKYKKHKSDCKCHPEILETRGWFVGHRGAQVQSDKIIDYYRKIVTYKDAQGRVVSFSIDMKPTGESILPGKTKHPLQPYDRIVCNIEEESRYMTEAQAAELATMVNPKRTVNYECVRGRDALPGEYAGIFPRVVNKLFDKRVPLKHELTRLAELRERLLAGEKVEGCNMDLEQISYEMVKLDSKQKAVKVIANTTYGKSGEVTSPIYMLLVAGAITQGGQTNVKMVHGYVENKGCKVYYGDTDSVYASAPSHLTAHIDKEYLERANELTRLSEGGSITSAEYVQRLGDLRVWKHTEKTKITMVSMTKLTEELGDLLLMDNGTRRLSLAYEEALDPCDFCGKKKYFGRAHIKTINYDSDPRTRFVRGIDIVKQGQSDVSRALGYEFIDTMLDVRRETDPGTLINELSRKFYNTDWPMETYILNARYKPQKKNIAVLNFVKRMTMLSENYRRLGDNVKAALYRPPEPGDKFQYVIVKRPVEYDIRGRKIKFGKSDLMEYVRVFSETKAYEIDMEYYMERQVAGVFARFVSYKYSDITDTDSKEQDKKRINAAKKEIMRYCNSITGVNKAAQRAVGDKNRKVYKQVVKKMATIDSTLSNSAQEYIYADYTEDTTVVQQLVAAATAVDLVESKASALRYYTLLSARLKLADIVKLIANRVNGRAMYAKRYYDRYIKDYYQKLYDLAPMAAKAIEERDAAIEFMVTNERNGIESQNPQINMTPLVEFDRIAVQYRIYKRMDSELEELLKIIDSSRADAMAAAASKMSHSARSIARESALASVKNNLLDDYVFK